MIEKLTIKHHGIKITVPSQILLLNDCVYVGKFNDHLVLDKFRDFDNGQEIFIILRKNGEMISGINTIYPIHFQNPNCQYTECSIEKYFKLRSFL